jgi:hypothetical protein
MTMSDPVAPSLARGFLSAARYYIGNRTGLIVVTATAFGVGAYFNWGWLVAAGIAPLIIGVLPCAAMCALGLCMSGRKQSPEAEKPAAENSGTNPGAARPLSLLTSDGESHAATADANSAATAPHNSKDCC